MSNVASIYQLECQQSFERDGFQQMVRSLYQTAGRFQLVPDNLKTTYAAASAKADLQTGATKIFALSVATQATAAATVWLQVFNVASASVTLGTTSPDIQIGPILAGETASVVFPQGRTFGTNCSYACTTTAGGATPVATVNIPTVTFHYA